MVLMAFQHFEKGYIQLNSKKSSPHIALDVLRAYINDEEIKKILTEQLFIEYRNWRNGGEATWDLFHPVVNTFIILGINLNVTLVGNF